MSTRDRIAAAGRAAIAAGSHRVDAPPSPGGRWGLSAVLLLKGPVADELTALTDEAASIAGAHHWRSGADGRAHVTVRALEHYGGDADHEPYLDALGLAAAGPITLHFDALSVSDATVVAWGTDVDGRADDLRRRYADALGGRGWLEHAHLPGGRDPVWYCSVLHFTGPIMRPPELLDWVDRVAVTTTATFATVDLCQWSFDGAGMRPVVVGSAPLD